VDDKPNYDTDNRNQAFGRAKRWEKRLTKGFLYRTKRGTLDQKTSAVKRRPFVGQVIDQAAFGGINDAFR
jgi:hypothetical protein